MDDRNKLIEKLGELSAKAYMFGRMYNIDAVTELTKDINALIAKVFDYSPWHTGTPTEYGWYLVAYRKRDCDGSFYWDYGTRVWEDYGEYGHWNITSMKYPVIKWQKINELVEED